MSSLVGDLKGVGRTKKTVYIIVLAMKLFVIQYTKQMLQGMVSTTSIPARYIPLVHV